jgi:hypothetical protein
LEGGHSVPQLTLAPELEYWVEEASRAESDSDLSEPDPPAFQVECQERVREMGGNSGGLWR